jgi:predicted polyphosphate/ATP-dependent NAD kinase
VKVGILANPASGRDIRRVVARASVFPTAEKCNMIQRILGALAVCGVGEVWMMPDKGGIASVIRRYYETTEAEHLPTLRFTDTPIKDAPHDTRLAVRAMLEAGISSIVVMGGDGTHRLVAEECGTVPMATLSTGTNNSFPELREATLSGLAAGLVAAGKLTPAVLRREKRLLVRKNGEICGTALVDVGVSADRFIAAKAVWETDRLRELFVTFASCEAIGLSSIASLLHPVGREENHGLHLRCAAEATRRITAPIAPGLFRDIGIEAWQTLPLAQPLPLQTPQGVLAMDGEREVEFGPSDQIEIELDRQGPVVIDVRQALAVAAAEGTMLR